MAHFLTIKILDPTKVTWRLIQTQTTLVFIIIFFLLIGLTRLNWVDSYGWSRALLVLGKFLAFLLLRLFGGLDRLLLLLGSSFLGPNLRFFNFKIFCCLGLSLNHGGVHWLVASVVVLINLATDKDLHLCFGLNPHCSLNQRVSSTYFLVFFIYSKPNWWPKAFIIVLAQDVFSWSIPHFKF